MREGTNYYVDSAASVGGDGLSPETAWRTIEQVNAYASFRPGDRILFRSGCVWEGVTLSPKGSGMEGKPIVMDRYGEGHLPVIDRKGRFLPGTENNTAACVLENQSWWVIQNICFSNQNPIHPGISEDVVVFEDHGEMPIRNGLVVRVRYQEGADENLVRGIHIRCVQVKGVDGTHGDEGNCYFYRAAGKPGHSGGGAICIAAVDSPDGRYRARMDGVTVEDCQVYNTAGTGISIGSGWKYRDSFRNVMVRRNCISCARDFPQSNCGMYIVSCIQPVAEHNIMRFMGNGLAFQLCSGALAQYNVVTNADGYLHTMSRFMGEAQHWDGVGFDADARCEGQIVFRCNYTYSCHSGAFGFFDYGETTKANIRIENNISHNDAKFLYYQMDTASYRFVLERNTVVRMPGCQYEGEHRVINPFVNDCAGCLEVRDNLFYYPGQTIDFDRQSCLYHHNACRIRRGILPDDRELVNLPDDEMVLLPDRESAVKMVLSNIVDHGYYAFEAVTGEGCGADIALFCQQACLSEERGID